MSIKGKIFRIIKEFPGVHLVYRNYTEKLIKKRDQNNTLKIFDEIHLKNSWGSGESISGVGSEIEQTKVVIETLPKLFEEYGIKRFLDAPCGDFNWMKNVDLSNLTQYIGGDIVNSIIESNSAKIRTDKISFLRLDIQKDKLPDVDMILVRDCLVHFSYEDIKSFFENLKKSNIKYILTTTFPFTIYNYNITTGNWRAINLRKKPFNFPKPLVLINENCTESNGQYFDKSLALWKVDDLKTFY